MKTCTKCNVVKCLEEFSPQAKGKYGVTSICKRCTSERGKVWTKANATRKAANQAAWIAKNIDSAKATSKAWREKNAASEKERLRSWAKNNAAKVAAKVAARRASILQATPAWVDAGHIAAFYRWAKEAEAATGIKWNVDHVVPLVSDVVCGLHCPANLCLLTETANKKKGNYWCSEPRRFLGVR